jgi:hypothetical protein
MRLLREQRRWIALSTVFIVLWQAGEVAVPVLIGVVIDRARHGGSFPGSPRSRLSTGRKACRTASAPAHRIKRPT